MLRLSFTRKHNFVSVIATTKATLSCSLEILSQEMKVSLRSVKHYEV